MAAGDETVIKCTGPGNWHYMGPADVPWTAANDGSSEARWTATTSTDPATAVGRSGMPIPPSEFKQAGDGEAGLHCHVSGADGVRIVVTEGV